MNDDILNDHEPLSLDDVCKNCSLDQETVLTYVHEGLIEVTSYNANIMKFSQSHIVRIQKAHRLERDLRLNPAGSVLVLELIAQIDDLKNQLKYFKRSTLSHQNEE